MPTLDWLNRDDAFLMTEGVLPTHKGEHLHAVPKAAAAVAALPSSSNKKPE